MADQIAVMNGGRIEQLGTPSELYEQPRTAFVAGFLGVSNLLYGTVGRATTACGSRTARRYRCRARRSPAARGKVAVGVRPEKLRLGGGGGEHARRRASSRARTSASRRSTSSTRRRARSRSTSRTTGRVRTGSRPATGSPWLEPGVHASSSTHQEASNDSISYTRADFLRRAAAGGTRPHRSRACSPPAAAAGSARRRPRRRASTQTLPKTLIFSNWPLYIDVNEKTKSIRRSTQFTKKYGVKVSYIEDINDNDSFFGKIQGPLSQGQSIGRDIIVLTDSSGLPGADDRARLGREARQVRRSRTSRTSARAAAPGLGPEPRLQPAVAVGHDRHRLRPEEGRRRHHSIDQLLTNPKLKGKVTLLTEFGDTIGLVMLANGDDPSKVTDASFNRAVDDDQEGGRLRADPPVHRQRLRAAAREGRRLGVRRVVGRHGPAPGRQPGPEVDPARRTGGMIWTDNMLIPKGGDVYRRRCYMNFVLPARRSRPRSRTTSTTSARSSAPTRCSRRPTRRSRRTR